MPLSREKEREFRKWYAGHAKKRRLSPNPDDPKHHYDYRAAFLAGARPDASGHWPSKYKTPGHPRTVVGGVHTRTGKRIPKSKRSKLQRERSARR